MTRAEQIAHHRAELARLEAEEKAQRPALAAGQVWEHPEHGRMLLASRIAHPEPILCMVMLDLAEVASDGVVELDDSWTFIARDALRVVPPDAVEQVAPVQDEPTGAELVGQRCWVRDCDSEEWAGPYVIQKYDEKDAKIPYLTVQIGWCQKAKLYREGDTP